MSKISTEVKTIIYCGCGEVINFVCPNCEQLEKRIIQLEEEMKRMKNDFITLKESALKDTGTRKSYFDKINEKIHMCNEGCKWNNCRRGYKN